MNKQEILAEMAELKERLNKLEKMYNSFNPPNKRWRAGKGNNYYYIGDNGTWYISTDNYNDKDDARYELGNYFETREQAEFEAERLKVIAELKGYATPVNEFNWSSNFEIKYVLIVEDNKEGNSILVVDDWRTYQFSDLCFASEEVAKSAIESVGEERIMKYYFRRVRTNGDSN